MKVLLVEDDPVALGLVAHMLFSAGHDVETAGGGGEALSKLENEPLMVCDWEMPVMDGARLCRAARALPGGREMYLIMLTARGAADRFDALHAGADDYLIKPFDLHDLLASICAGERILAEKSAA